MKVHILGEENFSPIHIDGSDESTVEELLERFLSPHYYPNGHNLKHKPLLITFDDDEKEKMFQDSFFRGNKENKLAFIFRMLETAANNVNKNFALICGFKVLYIQGKATRAVGVFFYEPPIVTTVMPTDGSFPKETKSSFYTMLGSFAPPSL